MRAVDIIVELQEYDHFPVLPTYGEWEEFEDYLTDKEWIHEYVTEELWYPLKEHLEEVIAQMGANKSELYKKARETSPETQDELDETVISYVINMLVEEVTGEELIKATALAWGWRHKFGKYGMLYFGNEVFVAIDEEWE